MLAMGNRVVRLGQPNKRLGGVRTHMSNMSDRVASSKQLGFMEDILTRNGLYHNEFERLWKMLEAARIDERTPGDGTPISMQRAHEIIQWLLRHNYR